MKSLETANKGLKALAKENPSLVEDKFGYDVPGYMMGGIANFAPGGSVFGPMMLSNPTLMPGSDINIPNIESGKDIDFSDVFDKDAQDEAQEDLDEINEEEETNESVEETTIEEDSFDEMYNYEEDKEKSHSDRDQSEAENNDRSFKSNRRNRNNLHQSKSVEGEDNPSSDKVSKEAAE